jgi:hypothetical protein
MKKAGCFFGVVLVLLFAITIPAYARDGGHFRSGGHFYGGSHFRSGGHFYGGGHFRGGGHFSGGIWIGPVWGGWDPWWGPPYYYPYYPSYYPYYPETPSIIQQQTPVYVQPAPQPEEQYYWYFCPDTKSYYPYVKKCPSKWLRVIPRAPSEEEE